MRSSQRFEKELLSGFGVRTVAAEKDLSVLPDAQSTARVEVSPFLFDFDVGRVNAPTSPRVAFIWESASLIEAWA